MKRVTYTRQQTLEAREAWGSFSAEWDAWTLMASRGPGIIFPPSGSVHDSSEDGHPSQRAIIVRAIRDTPDLLRWAIRGCKEPSWSKVIERLLSGISEMREQVGLEVERDEQRPSLDPTPREAMQRLGDYLNIVKDSAA